MRDADSRLEESCWGTDGSQAVEPDRPCGSSFNQVRSVAGELPHRKSGNSSMSGRYALTRLRETGP